MALTPVDTNEGVTSEIAAVWRGGGRRYFTRHAACRGAARAFLKAELRGMGEDGLPPEMFEREVARMAGEISRGDAPTMDWDAAYERAAGDGDPRTPRCGVAT